MSLASAVRTLVVERRAPYRVTQAWEHIAKAVGLTEKTVKAEGFTLRVRRLTCDTQFVRNVITGREYLPTGITIQPTDTVVDIGGNIGTFSVQAAALAHRGRVVVAEPEADNLRLLRLNVARNAAANVTIMPVAVAGKTGEIVLYQSVEGGYHTIREGQLIGGPGIPTRVPCLSLPDLFMQSHIERCDLLKLDCEGAEYEILDNLEAATFRRIQQVAMEYHGGTIEPVIVSFRAHGFRVLRHTAFPRGGHLFLTRHQ
jgi:FkbM family methyltransferase